MKTITLTANTPTEQRILDFLNQNASDTLADRINAGQKTLAGAVRYATKQAKELAKNENSVCVEDAVVFGWVIHFFEEDSIPENEPKPAYKAPAGCKPRRVENIDDITDDSPKTPAPPKPQQLTLFKELYSAGGTK